MKSYVLISYIAALGLGVSGCFFDPAPPTAGPSVYMSSGIEGQWVDPNGVISSFRSGVFESRSGDTHEKLSEGNYVLQAPNLVNIEIRSLVRGTVSRANCALANTTRLLCTTESGAKFALNRSS